MNFLANVLSTIGTAMAGGSSNACIIIMIDEPECPESLIK